MGNAPVKYVDAVDLQDVLKFEAEDRKCKEQKTDGLPSFLSLRLASLDLSAGSF